MSRFFLRHTLAATVTVIVLGAGAGRAAPDRPANPAKMENAAESSVDAWEEAFAHPPASAQPRTFWLWMNGNVTRDGITRDLEAMHRVGIGGVMIFDGSTYLPAGPAGYLSSEWRALMTHAIREGNRLGIDIGMHNAPGWSSTGGPWITPAQSMQQVVWTETTVQGGQALDVALARPQANADFYRDAMVVAFPAAPGERKPYLEEVARATRGGEAIPNATLSDDNLNTTVKLTATEPLQIEFTAPVSLEALSAWPSPKGKFPGLQVETSLDGQTYTPLCSVSNPGRHSILFPATRTFAPVTAKYVRATAKGAGELAEFVLHRSARLADWPAKANFDYRVYSDVVLPNTAPMSGVVSPASVVNLSSKLEGDHLRWDAPPGAWTILRVGHTTTGKENVAASAAGRGLECDKFDPAAVEFHFQHVIEKVLADAAAAGVKGPATLTIDSYEAGMQNWTARFPDEFRRRAGYELSHYIPAMFGRIVGDAGQTERFLFDVRRVQADLIAENYYGRMHELARSKGIKFYIEGYGPGNFDELKVAGSPDVPTTEFWTRTPWTPNRTVKMVTSAAHVYGKPIVAAESFTGEAQTSRWLEYPYALKMLGDEMFAQGLNEMVFHRYAHQPHPDAVPGMTMGPWGFHFDRTNTWFEQSRDWIAYITRTQHLLRQGHYVADVLFFTGEGTPNGSQYAIPVVPRGTQYDLVNADVLLNRIRIENGTWTLPEGGRYALLVLPPELTSMTPALAKRLQELVAQGGALLGPKPTFSPTLTGYPESEDELKRAADALWDANRRGGGRVFAGMTIADALAEMKVKPDFSFQGEHADASLAWGHRRLSTGELYFVSNRQRRTEQGVASFRDAAGRVPEVWRPETASHGQAAVFSRENERTLVPLRFEPGEALFIFFRHATDAATIPAAATLTRDGKPLLSTQAASADAPDASQNFTMAIWVKPDTDLRVLPKESTTGRIDEVGKFYAIPADPGDRRFGAGHATAGLAVGRNGIFVVERATESCPAVLVSPTPVSGWTHVAVVYRDGTPSLYVNGQHVRDGQRSGKIVHSGVNAPPPPVDYTLNFPGIESLTRAAGRSAPPSRGQVYVFEGNFAPAESFARSLPANDVAALAKAGVPTPALPVVTDVVSRSAKSAVTALVWESGSYALGQNPPVVAKIPDPQLVDGPWEVAFQPGRAAPAKLQFEQLKSWHLLDDPGVKYFSGTATYHRKVRIDAANSANQRVILDLGRVEVMAEVRVNGRDIATLWKEPYRTDITDAVKAGENDLEIRVTNLWTNRLIGDEQLPAEDEFGLHDERGEDRAGIVRLPEWYLKGKPKPPGGRTTFATWKFYRAQDPLVASGLLGPVRLVYPQTVTLSR